MLKILSLQRRLELYRIIYALKVLERIVPNWGLVPEACTAETKPNNSSIDQVKVVQKRSHG